MASSEDFKRILELYNQESKTNGISIVSFCQKNGIVYSQFEKWYKNRHRVKVHAVDIVNKNDGSQVQEELPSEPYSITEQTSESQGGIQITAPLFTIQIRSTTGMFWKHWR